MSKLHASMLALVHYGRMSPAAGPLSQFSVNVSYLAQWEPLENVLLAQDGRAKGTIGERNLVDRLVFAKLEAGLA